MTDDITWNFSAIEEAIEATPIAVREWLSISQSEGDIPLTSATHNVLLKFSKEHGLKSRPKGSPKVWRLKMRREFFFNGLIQRINQALTEASCKALSSVETILDSDVQYGDEVDPGNGSVLHRRCAKDFPWFEEELHSLKLISELHKNSQKTQERVISFLQIDALSQDADREISVYMDLYDQLKQSILQEENEKRKAVGIDLKNVMDSKLEDLWKHASSNSIVIAECWKAEVLPIHLAQELDPEFLAMHASSLRSIAGWMRCPGKIMTDSVGRKELIRIRECWMIHEDSRLCFLLLRRWIEHLLLLFSDDYCDLCWRHRGVSKRCRVHTASGRVPLTVRLAKQTKPVFLEIADVRLSSYRLRSLIFGSGLTTAVTIEHKRAVRKTGVSQKSAIDVLTELFLQVRLIFPALAGQKSHVSTCLDGGGPLADAAMGLFVAIFRATVSACNSIEADAVNQDLLPNQLNGLLKSVNLKLFFKLWFGRETWPLGHGLQVKGLQHDTLHPVINDDQYDIRRCVFDIARERAWLRAMELVLTACDPKAVRQIFNGFDINFDDSNWTSRSTRFERRKRAEKGKLVGQGEDGDTSAIQTMRLRPNAALLGSLLRNELLTENSLVRDLDTRGMPSEALDVPKIDFRLSLEDRIDLGYPINALNYKLV